MFLHRAFLSLSVSANPWTFKLPTRNFLAYGIGGVVCLCWTLCFLCLGYVCCHNRDCLNHLALL